MLGESSIPLKWSAYPSTNLQNYKKIEENIRDIQKIEKTKNCENSQKKNTHTKTRGKSPIQILSGNLSTTTKVLNKKAVDEDPLHQVAPNLPDPKNLIETWGRLKKGGKKWKMSGFLHTFLEDLVIWTVFRDLDCFDLKLFVGKNNLPTWSRKNIASKITDLCTHWDRTKSMSSLPCAQEQQTTLPLEMAQPQSFRRRTLACGNWPSSTFKPSSPHWKSPLKRSMARGATRVFERIHSVQKK